jgi:hypothetical protein
MSSAQWWREQATLNVTYVTMNQGFIGVHGIYQSTNFRKVCMKQCVFHKHVFCNIGNVVNIFATCPHTVFLFNCQKWKWNRVKEGRLNHKAVWGEGNWMQHCALKIFVEHCMANRIIPSYADLYIFSFADSKSS